MMKYLYRPVLLDVLSHEWSKRALSGGLGSGKRTRAAARHERSVRIETHRLIAQPVIRDPTVFPTMEGNRCKEAMVLDALSVTRKYNATDENTYTASSVLVQNCALLGGFAEVCTHAQMACANESNNEICSQDISF